MRTKGNKRRHKPLVAALLAVACIVVIALGTATLFMLDYALDYPQNERITRAEAIADVKRECPWTKQWVDSICKYKALRDTIVTMPSAERHHAIYLRAPKATGRTAIVVHGYKMRAEGMLHIAYMYNKVFGWNVLLPDLHAHGLSDGERIGMGWKERKDMLRWAAVADTLFRDSTGHSQQVMHGISMGAATVMATSGEETPAYVKAFVEDCGYTCVWDQFQTQLKALFSLPPFPLMYIASPVCKMMNGWSFGEARQIDQVAKCHKPMLFIHGTADTYVPTRMVRPLYEVKPGEKQIYMAKDSPHATSYCDHHEEYTEKVRAFLGISKSER